MIIQKYKSRSCKYSRFQLTSNQTSGIFLWTPGRINRNVKTGPRADKTFENSDINERKKFLETGSVPSGSIHTLFIDAHSAHFTHPTY